MIRTSLVLPEPLHQELVITSKQEKMSLTEMVRSILDREMAQRRTARLKAMYTTLRKMEGSGKSDISNASTTINTVLYGEEGAWKGIGE